MKRINIEEIEKFFYKKVMDNRHKLFLIVLLGIILANGPRLPYFNLIFTREISLLTLVFISLLIFNVKASLIFQAGIFLFLPAFIFQILGKSGIAESLGDVIYTVFLAGIIKSLCLSLRKTSSG